MNAFRWFNDQPGWRGAGRVAGSAIPETPEDVRWLHEQGVRAIASLQRPSEEVLAAMRALDPPIEWLDIQTAEGGAPSGETIECFLRFVDEQTAKDHPVLVHCSGGGGRTGTMHACLLVDRGATPEEALAVAGKVKPGSQTEAVFARKPRASR
jgi:atypical dual specificity phosphatase